jgi:hypothetical protein
MRTLIITPVFLMIIFCSSAQTAGGRQNWGGAGNSYLPYHQYLQQQYNTLQSSVNGIRSQVYNQIAYRQDTWDMNKEEYSFSDSGLFTYTNKGLPASYTAYSYVQGEWGGYCKLTYTYDRSGNLLAYLNQYQDTGSGNWINVSLFTNTYSETGQQLTALTQTWDSIGAGWKNVANNIYTYDSHGNKIQQTSKNWDNVNNVWSNCAQIQNSYDTNNRLTISVNQEGTTGGNWCNTGQTCNTYDGNGNMLLQSIQTWEDSNWVNYVTISNTFDSHNDLTSTTSQYWQNGAWVNSTLTDYAFDANNNQIKQAGLTWNTEYNVWDSAIVNTYTYSAANKILCETDQVYSPAGFTNINQYLYTYDNNNNSTEYQSFESTGSAWVPMAVYQYSYDENNNPVYEQYEAYNLQTSSLQPQNQYYFYYQSFDVTTAIASPQNDFGATVYPNPSSGSVIYVNLSVNEAAGIIISVYDVNGRMINSSFLSAESGSHRVELASASLASGTYFVRLVDSNAGKTSVLPFIKQ